MEKVSVLKSKNSELWSVLQLSLEWLHFGAIAGDDRNIFLSYRIALEVLMNYALKDDENTTVLKTLLDAKTHSKVINLIRGVLSLVIENTKLIDRVIHHVNDTRVTSETVKWAKILNDAGISVSSQELNDLRIARGAVVHTGMSGPAMSKTRMREIVVSYINTLLDDFD